MHKNDTTPFSLWDIPLALVLLTRLPLPRLQEALFARQAKAAWAFPIAGLIVAALACGIGWIGLWLGLPVIAVAIGLVTILIVTTGAMHEDGLADTVDGLWGGFTPERRLEIMKDSHIGTYGVLSLMLSQALRIAAVVTLLDARLLTGVLAASLFSRALLPGLMLTMRNARQSGLSQSVGTPPALSVLTGLGLAIALSVLLLGSGAILPMVVALIAAALVGSIAKSKIGGQTGDILGAAQQISEIAFLLTLIALI